MLPHTNSAVLGDPFRSRIRNIFNAAIDNDIRVLILGAFGCGAFKNPPEIVAQAFRDVLLEEHYDTCFTDIVFAIKSSNGNDPFKPCPNLMAFQLAFDGLSIGGCQAPLFRPHVAGGRCAYPGENTAGGAFPVENDKPRSRQTIFRLGRLCQHTGKL